MSTSTAPGHHKKGDLVVCRMLFVGRCEVNGISNSGRVRQKFGFTQKAYNGEQRLGLPWPLSLFFLSFFRTNNGALRVWCFRPIFNDSARARWVRFAKSLFVAALAGVV
jgi:hypothetical protein